MRSTKPHILDRGWSRKEGRLSLVRCGRHRRPSSRRWPRIRCPTRIRRGRGRHGGRRGCSSVRCRDRRANEGTGRLVPDAPRPVLSGARAGRSPSKPGCLCRSRARGGRARINGGISILWRPRRRRRRACPTADGCLSPSSARCRADRHDGHRGETLASADRSE